MTRRRNISSNNPFEEEYSATRGRCASATTSTWPAPAPGRRTTREAPTSNRWPALDIMAAALAEAGASLKDVVRTVVYVTDISDMKEVARAHHECFADVKPASTLVQVAALGRPQLRVEIEAYAILTEG